MLLAASLAALAASPTYSLGTPLGQAEIERFDRIALRVVCAC
jgi:hypothetical protein